jgi:hypothetical protein
MSVSKSKITNQINSLIELWRSEGVGISQGKTVEKIQEFEKRNSVSLPDDFRHYLLRVNGMYPQASQDTDRRGFCFWPLQRVVSVVNEFENNPAHKNDRIDASLENYFVFADYLQWSWAYAIQLRLGSGLARDIVKVDEPSRSIVIASSFAEFLELYLIDSPRLYDATVSRPPTGG